MTWYPTRLGDVVTLKRGYDLPEVEREVGDVPVVSSSGVTGYHSVARVAAPGVVTGRYGTLGQVFYVDRDFWPLNTALYVEDFKGNHPRFVAYLLEHVLGTQQTDKAAVPGVNRNALHEVGVSSADASTQECVVGVLAAYDDLIENNRRRVELLEAAARELYREWFVRLRFPGREHTRVVDGVPEGWEPRTLGACATFLSGGTPSKQRAEYWEGDLPWVSSGEMTETRLYDTPLHVTREAARAGSAVVPAGTILVVVRGMSLAKELRLAVVTREMAFNQDLKALVAVDDVDSEYLFASLLAVREEVRDLATEASHGTKKLDTTVLEAVPVLVPDARVQRLFREEVDPINALRDNLCRQNDLLQVARDRLLPRLMSGQIAV